MTIRLSLALSIFCSGVAVTGCDRAVDPPAVATVTPHDVASRVPSSTAFSIKGNRLGETEIEEFRSQNGDATFHERCDGVVVASVPDGYTIAEVPMTDVKFIFLDDRLAQIMANFNGGMASHIKEAFSTKFGAPKNGGSIWENDSSSITLIGNHGVGDSSLLISHSGLMKTVNERLKAQAQKDI